MEYRWADGEQGRIRDLVTDLVRLRVDIIVATGTDVIGAAREATKIIPIVMRGGSDPVGAGLVANLARPGGNITGVTSSNVELSGKRLELLRETVPRISRVAVLSHAGSTTGALSLKELEAAGQSFGIHLHILGVRGPGDFDAVLTPAIRERADALIVLTSPLFSTVGKRMADFVTKNRLPGISPYRDFAETGGLMAYGPDIPELSRRAASFVDKILKGAKPAELPVEQPTKLELVINMKTAGSLGLTIPPSILMRADEVIE
jgi:putative tryptophan/tyrosine transport system substrate-binding protein